MNLESWYLNHVTLGCPSSGYDALRAEMYNKILRLKKRKEIDALALLLWELCSQTHVWKMAGRKECVRREAWFMSEMEESGCCPGWSQAGTSGLAAGDIKPEGYRDAVNHARVQFTQACKHCKSSCNDTVIFTVGFILWKKQETHIIWSVPTLSRWPYACCRAEVFEFVREKRDVYESAKVAQEQNVLWAPHSW